MKTALKFLTKEGAFYIAFAPSLSAEDYAELLSLVEPIDSHDGLRTAVQEWAQANGLRLSFDEGKDPE